MSLAVKTPLPAPVLPQPPGRRPARRAPTQGAHLLRLDILFTAAFVALLGVSAVSGSMMAMAATGVLGLYVIFFVLVRRPIWALCAALVAQHFSGLFKQALDHSQASYFIQDGTFVLVLVPLVLRRVVCAPAKPLPSVRLTAIDVLLGLFVVFTYVQAFNPDSPSPWLVLAAVRVRLLPILMYVFVRGLLREGYQLEKPLFFILGMGALCGALFAMYESSIGETGVKALGPGFWPKQVSRTWGDAQGHEHFRPPSIYTDAGIAVVVAGMYAFMAMLRPYRMSLLGNIARYGTLLLCLTQVIVTGSRSGFLVIVVGFLFLAVVTRRRAITVALLCLPLVLGLAMLIQPQILDRYATVTDPTKAYQDNRGWTVPLFMHEMETHPFGYGAGTSTVGVGSVASLFGIPFDDETAVMDNGWLNTLHEVGVVGLALYLALLLTIFGYGLWLARRAPPGQAYLPLTMSVWTLILIVSTFGGVLTDAFPINVYYWAMLALMLGQARTLAVRRPPRLSSPRPMPRPLTEEVPL